MNWCINTLLVIGAIAACHAWLAPYVVKRNLQKAGFERPVSFYRKHIRSHYRIKHKSERQAVKNLFFSSDDDSSGELIAILFIILLCFGLFFPFETLLSPILYFAWESLNNTRKHLYVRQLPAYVALQGEEIGFLVFQKPVEAKVLHELLKEPMVRPESLAEFKRLQAIAIDVMELKEALDGVVEKHQNNPVEKDSRKDMWGNYEALSETYQAQCQEIQESEDVWLHLTGKQLHAGFNKVATKVKNRVESLNEVVEVTPIANLQSQTGNPAIDDMLQIANDPNVEEETRKLALATANGIKQKLLAEQSTHDQQVTHSTAMASIITARQMYELDKTSETMREQSF